MQFDHSRGTKSFTISQEYYRVSVDVLREELAKCDVVCANCHTVRTSLRARVGIKKTLHKHLLYQDDPIERELQRARKKAEAERELARVRQMVHLRVRHPKLKKGRSKKIIEANIAVLIRAKRHPARAREIALRKAGIVGRSKTKLGGGIKNPKRVEAGKRIYQMTSGLSRYNKRRTAAAKRRAARR
jgi:hypothetical protein